MSQLDDYLSLPWTIEREERCDDGHFIVLRIRELPGFVAAGRTDDEVEGLFWPALEAFLSSYVAEGDDPPLPRGSELHPRRYGATAAPPAQRREVTWSDRNEPVARTHDGGMRFEGVAPTVAVEMAGAR